MSQEITFFVVKITKIYASSITAVYKRSDSIEKINEFLVDYVRKQSEHFGGYDRFYLMELFIKLNPSLFTSFDLSNKQSYCWVIYRPGLTEFIKVQKVKILTKNIFVNTSGVPFVDSYEYLDVSIENFDVVSDLAIEDFIKQVNKENSLGSLQSMYELIKFFSGYKKSVLTKALRNRIAKIFKELKKN